ncbi:MAG: hypothetical protein MJ097_02750 [Dorea sp.]|nr:hypothetical protein [Dorea sp.]
MNKKKVDAYIPRAYEILAQTKIASNGEIMKTYRSHISTFGASVYGGSLLATVAFFSNDGTSGEVKVSRSRLMNAIYMLVTGETDPMKVSSRSLFQYICDHKGETLASERKLREEILDAAIALKVAMSLYNLVKEND